MEIKKILLSLIIILIIFEIIMSIYLIYLDRTRITGMCVLGSHCDQVQDSKYGSILGMKLPYLALISFIFLLFLFFVNKKMFFSGSVLGTLFAVYLIVLQLFVLKQICINCMIIDSSMIIIFVLSLVFAIKFK